MITVVWVECTNVHNSPLKHAEMQLFDLVLFHSIINKCPYINAIKIYLLWSYLYWLFCVFIIGWFEFWPLDLLFWKYMYIINEWLRSQMIKLIIIYGRDSDYSVLKPPFIISRFCIISIFYSTQAIGMSWVKTYK